MLIPQFLRMETEATLALVSRAARGLLPPGALKGFCGPGLAAFAATWAANTGVAMGFTPDHVLDARALARAIQADPDRLWVVWVNGWRHTAGAPRIIIGTPLDGRPSEIEGRLAAALEARRRKPPTKSAQPQRELLRLEGRGVNRAIRNRGWDRLL